MDLMDLVAERVKILYEGVWKENQVKIKEDNRYIPRISKEMKKIAEARFTERKAKNPRLFDGDVFHLDSKHSVIRPNYILLAVGTIKYSLYDIARKECAEKYGWKDLPTGIGTGAIISTSDSKIVMHHRFPHVDFTAKIGAVGGVYDGGTPFDHIRREIKEELGINKKEVKKIYLIGIANRLDEQMDHELIFLVQTSLTANQIAEKAERAKDKEGEVFFLNHSPKKLKKCLKENRKNITSCSFAALVIAGHYFWGPSWSKIN